MSVGPQLAYDRATGAFAGASAREQLAALAFRAGARLSAAWSYRGFATTCRAVRSVLPGRDITVRLNADALFAFTYGDCNWTLLLDRNYCYEPDLDMFFAGIADAGYTLIDCGANQGYWSVLATSEPYGAHGAIAIEPSDRNFAALVNNARLNGNRFKTIQRAIGGMPGVAPGTTPDETRVAEPVSVMSLDALIDKRLITAFGRYVIKLDLAGFEIEAMRGGERLLTSDCVVIFHERGREAERKVAQHVLADTRLKLFCFDRGTGHFEHLRDVAALGRIKLRPGVGYTMLATKSAFWESRIRGLSGQPARSH